MNSAKMSFHEEPIFDFDLPSGYKWLLERSLIDFFPHSQLQPWYYLDAKSIFSATHKWPEVTYSRGELIAFARRQDCDDIACFSVQAGRVDTIVVIHGWTGQGYEIVGRYESFWDWLKSVIDDMAVWVEG
jgi:hypothetical protein